MSLLFEDAVDTGKPIELSKKYWDTYLQEMMPSQELAWKDDKSFWLKTMGQGKDGKIEYTGSVRMSFAIYPVGLAHANPVGAARSEPN